MKKILIFVMVGVIALYGSNSVQAKSIRPKYDEYFDAPEPDFSEIDSSEEISIQQEMDYVSMSLLSCPSEDQYETNDSFDLATKKYHYSDLYATISDVPWYCSGGNDFVDYYYINIIRNEDLVIELSSLPKDYDMKLYDEFGNFIKGSYYGGTTNDKITYTAKPGTYFVKVYAYNTSQYDNYDTYKLDFDYTTNYTGNLYLNSSVLSNNVGAIWTSDYFPRDIHPKDYDGSKLYSLVEGGTLVDDFYLRMLTERGLYDEYLSRILYIWDVDAKQSLESDVLYLLDEIEAEIGLSAPNATNYKIKLELTQVSLATAWLAITVTNPVGAMVTFTLVSVGSATIAYLIPANELEMDLVYYGYYLSTLLGNLQNSPDGEIIQIKEYFNVYREFTPNMPEYTISYDYFYSNGINLDERYVSHIFTGTYIDDCQSGNDFYGTIELLQTEEDIAEHLFVFD